MTVTPAVSERFGVWFCQDSRYPNHTKLNGEDEQQLEATQGSRKGRPRLGAPALSLSDHRPLLVLERRLKATFSR